MSRELVIYCDESDTSGRHFANFYGGALVESPHLAEVVARLDASKARLNLLAEVKWQKITENYAQKYIDFIDEAFALMAEGKLKVRIMFTQNYYSAHRLTTQQRENGFFLLYYQFVKHAFGLQFAGQPGQLTGVRIYFDKLPDTAEKCAAFKGYVCGLSKNHGFRNAGMEIRQDQLAEVDSKDHVVLQALDVILGAMQFRLNDKHLEKPEGSRTRGKRTVAKERVYKHIYAGIRALYGDKQFNIGVSTGRPDPTQHHEWNDPHRHWLFKPKDAVVKPEFAKERNRRSSRGEA
ncbi:MAG: DUF3800 domain-containing protein [Burkholderiales bacterium]|nr:DUF3800 domain-containing protein [Burkholderiales bacterium]